MATVLVSAGDASGDVHAADLVRALRERVPGVRVLGLGGEAMRRAGVELVADQADLAVGGFVEVAGSAARVVRVFRAMAAAVREQRPALVVLVDSGGFNLPLARLVRRRGGARILYYVAPQVWAWRKGRTRKLARRVDRAALILPFEAEAYRDVDLDVRFVGHPLVDACGSLRERLDRAGARKALGLDPARRLVAILPGSRRNEIDRHLPLQLRAAARVHERAPDVDFVLALAPSVARERIEAGLRDAGLPTSLRIDVVEGSTREALLAADVAVAKPGTVTVEAMLLDCPMVVIGRANPLSAALARRLIRVPWLAMPNLVAGREIVPELLQQDATPARIAQAVQDLLEPAAADRQREALRAAARRLGGGGAAERAAAIAEEMLVGPRARD